MEHALPATQAPKEFTSRVPKDMETEFTETAAEAFSEIGLI